MALSQKASFINKVLIAYGTSIGTIRNYGKHFDQRFRALRRKKMEAFRSKQWGNSKEEKIEKLRASGAIPSFMAKDLPFHIGSTSVIMDPYEPPLGDGSFSNIKKMVHSGVDVTLKGSKNYFNIRKLRNYDSNFDAKSFVHDAKEIYIMAHKALTSHNLNDLEKYTTERAFNIMLKNSENKTIKWEYLESLDLPTTVHVRVQALSESTNVFGQVTVRFHSKQMLAIYDRFGRLMYGSDILAKDVLEYAVFEKHLSNVYGTWKLHDKIIPDWAPPKDPVPKTYKEIPNMSEDDIVEQEIENRGLIERTNVKELKE